MLTPEVEVGGFETGLRVNWVFPCLKRGIENSTWESENSGDGLFTCGDANVVPGASFSSSI